MRVAIVGSRTFHDKDLLYRTMDTLTYEDKPVIPTLIVSGGASGADTLGEAWAKEKSIPTKIFKPDWVKYGRAAGPIRNREIVKEADLIVAFWDGMSKGTMSTRNEARKASKPFICVKFES